MLRFFFPPYVNVYLYFLVQYLCNPMVKHNIVCSWCVLQSGWGLWESSNKKLTIHGMPARTFGFKNSDLGTCGGHRTKNQNSWHASMDELRTEIRTLGPLAVFRLQNDNS